jgi:hypothetical protein
MTPEVRHFITEVLRVPECLFVVCLPPCGVAEFPPNACRGELRLAEERAKSGGEVFTVGGGLDRLVERRKCAASQAKGALDPAEDIPDVARCSNRPRKAAQGAPGFPQGVHKPRRIQGHRRG